MSSDTNPSTGRQQPNRRINHLVGLVPSYWSYVPMTIMDVLNLQLIDGINCLGYEIATSTSTASSALSQNQTSNGPNNYNIIPVSKCLLIGYIVYMDIRRDGSTVYIIDDGTGFIDCLHWSTNVNHQDIYYLPSIFDTDDDDKFVVGDYVRIFGKIDCLAILKKNTAINNGDCNGHTNMKSHIVREVQISSIEHVNDITIEAEHWMKCMTSTPSTIQSCVDRLGPKIQLQMENRMHLPSVDDTTGSWRVFGVHCQCQLPYMKNLLYCHCQAKIEPLDPTFNFRDELLQILLKMQDDTMKKLVFKYKDMKSNQQLQSMACEQIKETGTTRDILINKLFLNTFRALRHDGIVYLLNSNTDEYLLITRDKVLEPYVQMINNKDGISTSKKTNNYISFQEAPPYISRIHYERLLYIKRSM